MLSRFLTPMQSMTIGRNYLKKKTPFRKQVIRQFGRDGRGTYTGTERIAQRRTLTVTINALAGPNGMPKFKRGLKCLRVQRNFLISSIAIYKSAFSTGSAIAVSALLIYRLNLSSNKSTILNDSMLVVSINN